MISETFKWITIFAITSAIVNTLGIFSIYRKKKFTEKLKNYFMCFAAGVLISTPLIIALPNALRKNPYSGLVALLGFLFMFFSDKAIKKITDKKNLAFGIVAAEGIGIHSLIDGVIYSVTFSVSIMIGFLSAIGLVIHEFAEGVITYSVLIKGKIRPKLAFFYAFLIAGLTTPIGAFVAYPIVKNLNKSYLGLMLGFVAGVLIYVSASHLLPEATKEQKKHSIVAFLSGVALAIIILVLK